MGWGIQTQGVFGRLPIDDTYKNLVRRRDGSALLSSGYRTVVLESRGVPSLAVAARHPGLDVAFLGFISDRYGVTGVRLYVRGSGRFYWRTFEDMYPLPMSGWGMAVFNAAGEQTFHSDHHYADVLDTRFHIGPGHNLGGAYYLLATPMTPSFEYTPRNQYWTRAKWGYVTRTRTVYKQVREYVCAYRSEYVCETGYEYDWNGNLVLVTNCGTQLVYSCQYEYVYRFVEETYQSLEIVGYYYDVLNELRCKKVLALARHSTSDVLSTYEHVQRDEVCWGSFDTYYVSGNILVTPTYVFTSGFSDQFMYLGEGTRLVILR